MSESRPYVIIRNLFGEILETGAELTLSRRIPVEELPSDLHPLLKLAGEESGYYDVITDFDKSTLLIHPFHNGTTMCFIAHQGKVVHIEFPGNVIVVCDRGCGITDNKSMDCQKISGPLLIEFGSPQA